jgi:Rps23 Pro-64 3,4-dihydroxylase Tpa1-like proline 4-hydroxylase
MTVPAVKQFSERVRSARLITTPWSFSYLEEALPLDLATRLSRLFGELDLVASERQEGQKTYRFLTATFDATSRVSDAQCMNLLDFLRGDEYRNLMSDLTGLALEDCSCTLSVWEYQGGDWLSPHVDKPDKIVTQIFYLTERWKDDDGGRLLILTDSNPQSVVHALPPRLGSSAVIVRSEDSWHAVEQVPPGAAPRKSLTVTFRSDEPDSTTNVASRPYTGNH